MTLMSRGYRPKHLSRPYWLLLPTGHLQARPCLWDLLRLHINIIVFVYVGGIAVGGLAGQKALPQFFGQDLKRNALLG